MLFYDEDCKLVDTIKKADIEFRKTQISLKKQFRAEFDELKFLFELAVKNKNDAKLLFVIAQRLIDGNRHLTKERLSKLKDLVPGYFDISIEISSKFSVTFCQSLLFHSSDYDLVRIAIQLYDPFKNNSNILYFLSEIEDNYYVGKIINSSYYTINLILSILEDLPKIKIYLNKDLKDEWYSKLKNIVFNLYSSIYLKSLNFYGNYPKLDYDKYDASKIYFEKHIDRFFDKITAI